MAAWSWSISLPAIYRPPAINGRAEYAAAHARFSTPPFSGLYIGQPERAKAALDEWMTSHPAPAATLAEVADHIEHIRQIAGIDHVGIGTDFDGVSATPKGLEGVDKYPDLLVELLKRGWTDDQLAHADYRLPEMTVRHLLISPLKNQPRQDRTAAQLPPRFGQLIPWQFRVRIMRDMQTVIPQRARVPERT